jgi:hypothetical protein
VSDTPTKLEIQHPAPTANTGPTEIAVVQATKPRPHLPNTTTAPPGGWRYRAPETGQLFRGASLSDLISQLNAHYRANGYDTPLAGFKPLIEDYICAETPETCDDSYVRPATQTESVGVAGQLAHTFHTVLQGTATLVSWLAGGGERVTQQVAEVRAATCASCPENVEPQGCTGCNIGALRAVADRVAGKRTTPHDGALKSCRICACHLRAKVWLPLKILTQHMPAKQQARLPEHCWIKQEAAKS